MATWEGTKVGRTACSVASVPDPEPVWFRTAAGWTAYELIRLYKQEFRGDWEEFYVKTVKIEAKV